MNKVRTRYDRIHKVVEATLLSDHIVNSSKNYVGYRVSLPDGSKIYFTAVLSNRWYRNQARKIKRFYLLAKEKSHPSAKHCVMQLGLQEQDRRAKVLFPAHADYAPLLAQQPTVYLVDWMRSNLGVHPVHQSLLPSAEPFVDYYDIWGGIVRTEENLAMVKICS